MDVVFSSTTLKHILHMMYKPNRRPLTEYDLEDITIIVFYIISCHLMYL